MAYRLSEEEAIEKGYINSPATPPPPPLVYQVPVPTGRYSSGVRLSHILWAILGWCAGFLMGMGAVR